MRIRTRVLVASLVHAAILIVGIAHIADAQRTPSRERGRRPSATTARGVLPHCPSECSAFPDCTPGVVPTNWLAADNATFGESTGVVTVLYDKAGHYSSPYIVAIAAGLTPSDAAELAMWAQYPDDDLRYTATEGLALNWPWFSYDLQVYLHSLRGTDSCAVRSSLLETFARMKEPWARGLLVHALGDAYAHARPCASGTAPCCGRLYGWPLGHGLKGHAPDLISNDTPKYLQYVRVLYGALEQPGASPQIIEALEQCVKSNEFPTDIHGEMLALNCFACTYPLPYRPWEKPKEKLPRCQVRQWIAQVKYNDTRP